jgi:uncharacterized repeat protein (TIGR04076 family)
MSIKAGIKENSLERDNSSKIDRRWQKFQKDLGYTDEELALYMSNPKHIKAMENASDFSTYNIVVEIIESKNCGAGYRVGDKFVIGGDGCLMSNESPPKLCLAALYAMKPLVDRMWQAFYHGSTEVLHDTVHCPDVGVENGGWGKVLMRVYAVSKKKND